MTKAALGILIATLMAGCGDTFRPVANPITQPGGDPAGLGNAIILSANGTGTTPGTTSHINVSGDTVTAVHNVSANPVHAILVGSEVIVANKNDGTLSLYPVTAAPDASIQTLTLPSAVPGVPDARPVFLAADGSNIYVAQNGRNSVEVVLQATLSTAQEITTSISAPTAIVVLPSKVYVANSGSGLVTIIDPALAATDPVAAVKGTIPVGSSPAAMVASADNNCVYVANSGGGTVSVINAGNDTVAGTITVGATPKFLLFDKKLQRVYVANSGGNTVSIINHAADCSASSSTPVTVHAGPQSITALADGSRAYVANSDGTVSVILTSSNTVKIFPGPLDNISAGGAATTVSIGSSIDSAKVFVANSGGTISVIRTSDDSRILQLTGPSGPNKLPGAPNPQFVLMF